MEILNIQQIKQLKHLELDKKILEVRKELFNLRFKQATKQSIKTHLFRSYKRMLAQLLTIETQLNL